ncbi:hypothetical protein BW723_05915 [Polaribacter reichenbachii]|uniref:Uncharacterized protein n=1 Tax=Polaribacter reichenbachii TaxID=996801 RepID=A0A1B8TYM4_9FLAO|nr:hypothetical protein [Polaribacter reichenbachii]APZ45857.1 hypothetical protein BW723_05915 [Polaribacter reichenbachii]AUC19719.1 hypothetical protein BTO17_13930 [Polaribacter reichenbachii]OBY64710.1 hypothetical protein LPB301_09805 [Polaribacter reichenbachii]
MTEETLIKYLEFLKTECLRHQNDKIITDDELNQLEIEITRFTKRVKENEFSEKLKFEISKIDFNLDEENHNHSKFKIFNFIGGFQGKEFKEQENRKQRFLKLYHDLDASLFNIKSIL